MQKTNVVAINNSAGISPVSCKSLLLAGRLPAFLFGNQRVGKFKPPTEKMERSNAFGGLFSGGKRARTPVDPWYLNETLTKSGETEGVLSRER